MTYNTTPAEEYRKLVNLLESIEEPTQEQLDEINWKKAAAGAAAAGALGAGALGAGDAKAFSLGDVMSAANTIQQIASAVQGAPEAPQSQQRQAAPQQTQQAEPQQSMNDREAKRQADLRAGEQARAEFERQGKAQGAISGYPTAPDHVVQQRQADIQKSRAQSGTPYDNVIRDLQSQRDSTAKMPPGPARDKQLMNLDSKLADLKQQQRNMREDKMSPAEEYRKLVNVLENIDSVNEQYLEEDMPSWIKKLAAGVVAAGALTGFSTGANADAGNDIAKAAMCSAVYQAGSALLDGKLADQQGIKSERAMMKAQQLAKKHGANMAEVEKLKKSTLQKYIDLSKQNPKALGTQVAGDIQQCDAVMNTIR